MIIATSHPTDRTVEGLRSGHRTELCTVRYVHTPVTLPSPSSERILESALELFSTRGYAATSVREICAAAQIAKPTLYHFFGSKEGLFRALVESILGGFMKQTEEIVRAPGSVVDRLKALARGHFEYARNNVRTVRFLHSLLYMPGESCPPTDLARFYEGLVGQIATLVDQAVAEGALAPGPTPIRMLAFMGAIGEAVHGYLFCQKPELTPELADLLVETVLDGWRPSSFVPTPERP